MADNTTDILQRRQISVHSKGEQVILRIGNSDVGFHYEDALKLSQWIRMMAKQSKKRAGDVSRHWSGLAIIEDAEEAYRLGR